MFAIVQKKDHSVLFVALMLTAFAVGSMILALASAGKL